MMGFLLLFVTIVALMFGFTWAMRAFGLTDSLSAGGSEPALGRADLERLHEAIAALDQRLERLEDQQRFLEGLLEDRSGPALPRPEEGGGDSILFETEDD